MDQQKKESPYERRAYAYLERGYCVIPIAPGTKRPGSWSEADGWKGMYDWERFGKRLPTETELEHFYRWPEAGIGLLTGKISTVVGIDRDYDTKGTDALDAIIPYSPVKKKGAKGYTAFFQYNGERSCSFNIGGMRVMDVLSDGRQTLMPGTVHPDGHTYIYLTEDCLEDFDPGELPKLPDDFLDHVARVLEPYQNDDDRKYQKKHIAPADNAGHINTELSIQAEYFRDLNRQALSRLDQWVPKLIPTARPERDGYRAIATWRNAEKHNVGIHPHGIFDFGGNYGMTPIDLVMYAHQIKFGQAADALRGCLALQEPEPIVFGAKPATKSSSVSSPASTPVLPWLKTTQAAPPAPIMVPSETSIDPEPAVPNFILNPPGILGDIARWITATAPKEQPELSVAAAIALCSVVMGRSYKTQFNNFTSLYVVMVAKSTEGKEHPQSAVEKILTAAGLEQLLGGSGYTSAGGVHSALLKSPCHVVMIDEMGKLLKLSRVKGNAHSEAAIDKLVEAFGRLDGVMRPPTYSNMTLSKSQAAGTERIVHNPAITLLGATTPGTFYDNLSNDLVKDGFLGRCIVVESKRPRQLTQFVKRTNPPTKIIDWCKSVHLSEAAPKGDLASLAFAEMPATLIDLPMSDDCLSLLTEIDKSMNDAKDMAEGDGLDMILGRTVEKAMRLALIVAKARNKDAKEVSRVDLQWAIEYVQHYDMALVRAVRDKRFENEHQMNANRVLDYIRRAKSLAKTTKNKIYAELLRDGAMPHSLLLQRMNMDSKKLSALIDTLIESEQIKRSPVDGNIVTQFKGGVYRIVHE